MTEKYAICVLETIGSGSTLSNKDDKESACIMAIKTIAKVMDLKIELQTEIQRLENLIIDETISDKEKVKILVALECYNKILNQLN